MRKALILLLVLAVLAAGGITATALQLNSSADAVLLQQQTLYGDAAAAAGLHIDSSLHSGRRLFWQLSFPVTENPGATVEMRQHLLPQDISGPSTHRHSGVSIGAYARGGSSTSGDFEENGWLDVGEPFQTLTPAFADVAARTPSGEQHTETVRLRDYFEYYPLSVDVDISGSGLFLLPDGSEPTPAALSAAFAAYFRIPVLEDNAVELTGGRDAAGRVQELQINDPEASGPELFGPGAVTENAAYFALRTDSRLDLSLLPDGTGIFCLPYEMSTAPSSDRPLPVIHPEQLCCVYPLPQDTVIADMRLTDRGTLLLFTLQDGSLRLDELALPAAAGQPLRRLYRLELLPAEDPYAFRAAVLFEDCLLVFSTQNEMLLLQRDADGAFQPVLCTDITAAVDAGLALPYGHDAVFAWDGERLAAVQYRAWTGAEGCCDIYAAVFDGSGLRYAGLITSTLSRNRGADSDGQVRPVDAAPLSARWLS